MDGINMVAFYNLIVGLNIFTAVMAVICLSYLLIKLKRRRCSLYAKKKTDQADWVDEFGFNDINDDTHISN